MSAAGLTQLQAPMARKTRATRAGCGSRGCLAALLVVLAFPAAAKLHAQQMPDPRQMSGVPLPVSDLPAGTVTVRVIRGSLANPIVSQTVEIVGTGSAVSAVTNDSGRAEFKGLAPGARIRAVAAIGSERLESQEFAVPASGGIRIMLVAADPGGAAPSSSETGQAVAPPAQPGTVVLGDESRFVFEIGEDGLSVFYILHIQNAGAAPVQPQTPVVFELPSDASGATILEGSSPQASVSGRELKIAGPFAPGGTVVQLAYTIPYGGSNLDIEQKLPIMLRHVAVVAQKVGDMRLTSPQIAEQRDMPAQGNIYIAGRGAAVAAGDTLRFSFSGMPHQSTWPRTLAIVVAVLVLATGAWSSLRAGAVKSPAAAQRQELESSRDRLFDELTALERRYREQGIDAARYAERRRELIAALERVYAALDDAAAVGRAS